MKLFLRKGLGLFLLSTPVWVVGYVGYDVFGFRPVLISFGSVAVIVGLVVLGSWLLEYP